MSKSSFLLSFALALAFCFSFAGAECPNNPLPCALSVPSGIHAVQCVVEWHHEDSERPCKAYSRTMSMVVSQPKTLRVTMHDGCIARVTWIVDGLQVTQCGIDPVVSGIFVACNGFESGDFGTWNDGEIPESNLLLTDTVLIAARE